jgi:AcrR family transcriptional regulator
VTVRARRRPGRPRDASYDPIILREVLREISEHGFKRFSVQRVADRAGVARATVRLRWPDRDRLILDGLATTRAAITMPSTGSLRGDLRHVVREWADVFRSEELMRLFGHLQAEQNDDSVFFERYQSAIARPANQIVVEVIERAVQRGEVRSGVNALAAARCLVGSLYLHSTMARGAITPEFEGDIVDLVAASVEAPTRGR